MALLRLVGVLWLRCRVGANASFSTFANLAGGALAWNSFESVKVLMG